jgi:hypothetical protein
MEAYPRVFLVLGAEIVEVILNLPIIKPDRDDQIKGKLRLSLFVSLCKEFVTLSLYRSTKEGRLILPIEFLSRRYL